MPCFEIPGNSMGWIQTWDVGERTCFSVETRHMTVKWPPAIAGLWIQAFGRVFQQLDSLDDKNMKRGSVWVCRECAVSEVKQIKRRSGFKQLGNGCKHLLPALYPVALNDLERLPMSAQPSLDRLEKRQPLCQLGLATQTVAGPFDLLRAQQQVQVVMTGQQRRLEPLRAIAEQGLAPEDVAQQVGVEDQQRRPLGTCRVFPGQLAGGDVGDVGQAGIALACSFTKACT